MRAIATSILLVFIVLMAIGCSDDDNPATTISDPQVLGLFRIDSSAGGSTVTNIMSMTIGIGGSFGNEATLIDLHYTNADTDTRITIDISDFREAAALLVNGENDQMEMSNLFPNGSGGGTTGNESGFFDGGVVGDYIPDFAGAEVTHLIIHFDSVNINSPGSDPNGDGNWTDSQMRGELLVMGRP